MMTDLEENSEEYGFLGSRSFVAAGGRSTNNELINVMYFRSNDYIHKFAEGKKHRDGLNCKLVVEDGIEKHVLTAIFLGWVKSVSQLNNLSISHEIYESDGRSTIHIITSSLLDASLR